MQQLAAMERHMSSEKIWQGIAVPGTAMGGENNTRGTDAHAT
jgi:hypothetical protein